MIEFNGGAKAGRTLTDSVEFQNERASAFFYIREALQAGRLALPPDELLVDELTGIRYHETPVGRVALEAKEELMARLNRSCDRADALSMSLAAQAVADEAATFRELAAWSRTHCAF